MSRVHATWVSERHLRLALHDAPSDAEEAAWVAATVHALAHAGDPLRPGLVDVVPAYATVTLEFEPLYLEHAGVDHIQHATLLALRRESAVPPPAPPRAIDIPICYGGEHGPDLPFVASTHGMSPDAAAKRHAAATYTVRFLGFSPGFPYLDGLPGDLATPRLETPRTRVAAGSVGIAGGQTGIYPHATPGGWRLVGRTPLRLFDAHRDPPNFLTLGDRVRFVPIDATRFDELTRREHSA